MRITNEEFELIIEEALDSIPPGFHQYLQDVAVDVEEMPDETVCRDLKIRNPRTLLGLYHGTPLPRRHVDEPYRYPERIVLYKANIERICRSKTQMIEQIRKTVLHEVGHHFGLNERQLRELGY